MSNVYRPKVGTVIQKRRSYPLFITRPLKAVTALATAGMFYSIHNSKPVLARQPGRINEYTDMNKVFSSFFSLPDRDYYGFSALHWACLVDDVHSVKKILEDGESAHSPPKRPVLFLILFNIYETLYFYYDRMILKNSKYYVAHHFFNGENETITPVELAFWNGSNDVVNHFLYSGIVDQKPSDGNDLLFLALSNKHISIASKLLDTGKYDSNSRNSDGYTQLQMQAMLGNEAGCKFLIKNGADIFASGPHGRQDAVSICENEFDSYEIQSRFKSKQNPYEKCLNYLEDYKEIKILEQNKKNDQ